MGTVPPLIISAVTGTLSVPSWDDAGLLVGIGVLSVMQQSGNSLALKVKEFAFADQTNQDLNPLCKMESNPINIIFSKDVRSQREA